MYLIGDLAKMLLEKTFKLKILQIETLSNTLLVSHINLDKKTNITNHKRNNEH